MALARANESLRLAFKREFEELFAVSDRSDVLFRISDIDGMRMGNDAWKVQCGVFNVINEWEGDVKKAFKAFLSTTCFDDLTPSHKKIVNRCLKNLQVVERQEAYLLVGRE